MLIIFLWTPVVISTTYTIYEVSTVCYHFTDEAIVAQGIFVSHSKVTELVSDGARF